MSRLLLLIVWTACALLAQPKDLQFFLLIGQSNMAGRGAIEEQDRQPIARVFMLNKGDEWVPAVDPLHFDKPTIAGVGIGRTFARVLANANPSANIGLVPCAFGGTSLDEWKPEGKLYGEAVRRARLAMKSGKLRGILWHQGEADSTTALAATYRLRFDVFMARLRADLDAADVPVVVGQLGEFFQPKGHPEAARTVNEQLAIIPLLVPHSGFASSAGLVHKGDSVHFDAASVREFGRRYAYVFLSLDPTWAPLR